MPLQVFTFNFKELLICGAKYLLEEFIPESACCRCMANAARSQLFVKERYFLPDKGLGKLPHGRSPTEKGATLGSRAGMSIPGQRPREAGHAACPPPSCPLEPNLRCRPFAPAAPRAGGDASAPGAIPSPCRRHPIAIPPPSHHHPAPTRQQEHHQGLGQSHRPAPLPGCQAEGAGFSQQRLAEDRTARLPTAQLKTLNSRRQKRRSVSSKADDFTSAQACGNAVLQETQNCILSRPQQEGIRAQDHSKAHAILFLCIPPVRITY